MSGRNFSLDTVGGIMICFMIFRHCFLGTGLDATFVGGKLTYYPLIFYMSWFFFKGGMFFDHSGKTSVSETIKKGMARLIVPFLAFSAFAIIIECMVHGLLEGLSGVKSTLYDIPSYLKREGCVAGNAPLWFLFSLFFVRVFYAFAIHLHIPRLLVSVISLISAYALFKADLPIALYFENIAIGLFFFSTGNILRDIQYTDPAFILSGILYTAYLLFAFCIHDITCEFRINAFVPYIPTIVFSLAGCIAINNLFNRIKSLNFNRLSKIGKSSMNYFTTHFIIIGTFGYLNRQLFHLNSLLFFILTIILLLLLLPPINRILSQDGFGWLNGKGLDHGGTIAVSERTATIGILVIIAAMAGYVISVAVKSSAL